MRNTGGIAQSISRPIPIDQTKVRYQTRMSVVYDNKLSVGARLLYVALDDMAGAKGECWPFQDTLAANLGCTSRNVRRWVTELCNETYISSERKGKYNLYFIGDRTKMSYQSLERQDKNVRSDRTEMSGEGGTYPYMNLEKNLGATCERCSGTGVLQLIEQFQNGPRKVQRRCGCTTLRGMEEEGLRQG